MLGWIFLLSNFIYKDHEKQVMILLNNIIFSDTDLITEFLMEKFWYYMDILNSNQIVKQLLFSEMVAK